MREIETAVLFLVRGLVREEREGFLEKVDEIGRESYVLRGEKILAEGIEIGMTGIGEHLGVVNEGK